MGKRCLNAILLTVLVLLNTSSLHAADRTEAAYDSLAYQIQLSNLIIPSTQLENDYKRLTSGLKNIERTSLERILLNLDAFWASNGVPNSTQKLVGSEDILTRAFALEPTSRDYLGIINRIRYQLWLSRTEQWQEIQLNVWLEMGDEHHAIIEISRRLMLLGDLDDAQVDNNVLDSRLVIGIKHFQKRHGLKQDGIIGPETLRWINTKPKRRARLLATNFIEKAQYLATTEPRFLLINIPAFHLELINGGKVELQSRVIVGKPYRQTPRINSRISNLVINPSWRVPRRLLTRDLLPKVRENGSYIEERNFDVFDRKGDMVRKTAQEWQDLAHGKFPYRLVQKPGVGNTLGRYKFFFKNEYNVYLHDTTDTELFNKANRALSSGCIRVENVEGLANWMASNLVKDKQTWVDMQVERQKTQWFSLDNSLPVHLVYWTAWVDTLGIAQYRNDIYHQNSTLNTKIAKLSP